MSQLQPYTGGGAVSSPLSRQGRAIGRIVGGAELATVRVAAAAHVEQARLDALDHVTSRAMQGVALVAQAEAHLVEVVPHAAGRVRHIANAHTLVLAGEVASFSRRLPS